ncbi:invasion protein [Bacillus cereus]|uniref:transglycosylase SLT domain-containing protein n=1 Tax=unclassified Bacillus (in: firmicutes) TaxID=185979 RepID=UPI00047A39C5|nr:MULTISPECIES: transglycosylase SLT domain-containing protein [unclassified Bacillus (in: firmicutes)]PFE03933.1 invasion protein [Bacillus sp. AFS023182]PGX93334.1 invasion protein [Bacillus cereus]
MKQLLKYIVVICTLTLLCYAAYMKYEKQKEIENNKLVITEISKQYGVPEWIPLAIADHETKFNRKAVGDKGTSFGLFQLHRGGLAPAQFSEENLKDAKTNATIAISHMVSSYKRGVNKGLTELALLKYVANTSGWPGNLGEDWTDNNTQYNVGLEKLYKLYKKD